MRLMKSRKIEDVYYPILKIMREETRGEVIDYIIDDTQRDIWMELFPNRKMDIEQNNRRGDR